MKKWKWMGMSRIPMTGYLAAFCLTVFLAVLLLAISAFLPQQSIQEHVLKSISVVSRDIENHYIFDNSIASKLDVATDTMMLKMSLMTNSNYPGSILTNPVYEYADLTEWHQMDEELARLAYGQPSDGVWFYARYWMGFRVILRLALSFCTYAQIKRYLAFLFLSLFAGAICSVSRDADSKIAFLFAVSIILVRPHVMATSMQLTCCFVIAFIAMLLIPWLHRHRKWERLFFLEVGMVTMYFDFYTVPLVTLGFPLMYLYVLKQREAVSYPVKKLLWNMAAWFSGYGFMWIAKLSLTTLLTSVDALEQGFRSLFGRIGIEKEMELAQYYSVKAAFQGVREAVFSDEVGMAVYLMCAVVILAGVLYRLVRGRISFGNFRNAAPYLFFAVLPLLWFVITKQPIAIHYYFQYRTIALTHWAAGIFLYTLLPAKNREWIRME